MQKAEDLQKRKTRIISQLDFVLFPKYKEKNVGISMTVPDESMTIREIMKKHVSGMRIADSLQRQGYYEEDVDHDSPDMEKVKNQDIFDRVERLNFEKSKQQSIQNQIQKNQQNQQNQKTDDANRQNTPKQANDKGAGREEGSSEANDARPAGDKK